MLERIRSDSLRAAYRYWDTKRRGRTAPSRLDLDPLEMKGFLSQVFLVDVEGRQPRYRVRLIGTSFALAYGEDITGSFIDELDLGISKERILAAFDQVARDCAPSYREPTQCRLSDGRVVAFECLRLPLSSDRNRVEMSFGAIVAFDLGKRSPPGPPNRGMHGAA